MYILFDGDDTLWGMQHVYYEARDKFLDLCKRQGINRADAERRFAEIDLERAIRNGGFDRLEFGQSMLDTYKELCMLYGAKYTTEIHADIVDLGEIPYRKRVRLIPQSEYDVAEVLNRLSSHRTILGGPPVGHTLMLYTSGRPDVQWRKAKETGLLKFFTNYIVLPNKNATLLRGILETYSIDPLDAVVVGNSLRSDIYPALEVGCHAVFIPNGGWAYDKVPTRPGYLQLTELSELLGENVWDTLKALKRVSTTSRAA
ncbi:MAG TPA: HAD family hydrolase [Ktedonobacteraceae bacterium]|jgi:putative hydrolase of the HAD superfamily